MIGIYEFDKTNNYDAKWNEWYDYDGQQTKLTELGQHSLEPWSFELSGTVASKMIIEARSDWYQKQKVTREPAIQDIRSFGYFYWGGGGGIGWLAV